MSEEGYSWWANRMKRAFELYDEFRIDHFRGLAGYWAVDAGALSLAQVVPHGPQGARWALTFTNSTSSCLSLSSRCRDSHGREVEGEKRKSSFGALKFHILTEFCFASLPSPSWDLEQSSLKPSRQQWAKLTSLLKIWSVLLLYFHLLCSESGQRVDLLIVPHFPPP